MNLYCNYAGEHWTNADENPPVGLILCAEKDAAVAHYALDGLLNKILAAEYRTALPDEKTLAAELDRARKVFLAAQLTVSTTMPVNLTVKRKKMKRAPAKPKEETRK
jgi:hypothetical protein